MTYYERNLPHWHPAGRAIFVTWRLNGSLPEHVLVAIRKSKQSNERQFARADRFLDKAAYGPLWLSQPEIAACVTNAILKGERELSRFKLLGLGRDAEPRSFADRAAYASEGNSERNQRRERA